MKVREIQIQKIKPKQINKIVNNKKSKPLEQRKNCINHKLQISKTLSMETISTGPKYTTRQKSTISDKLFNNSMEEIDYLNFSDIDIDLIKNISSCEKDIFKPNINSKNEGSKKEIVQNRYNMIDTSFNINQQEEVLNKNGDEYIEINKNILIKTPSTICNYYDMDSDKKNIKNNEKEKKNNKKVKNKQIQISNNSIFNYNNNPLHTNRIKQSKYDSLSNISLPHNSKRNFNNNNATLYKNKKSKNHINRDKTKNNKKEIIAEELKKRNQEIKNKISYQLKNDKNNIMKNYLQNTNKKYKNKTYSNQYKKSLYIKQYSEYITSQVIKKEKNKNKSNCNFTFNNDITLYLKKQKNIQDLFDSIKEIKETKVNNLDENVSDDSEENNEIQKIQKPIMLCLNKPKFNSYFKTPKNLSPYKNEKKKIKSVNKNKKLLIEKSNIIEDNYTCRNYIKSCRTSHNDIVVKRKKNDLKNNIRECYKDLCTKSINSNKNKKINDNNSTKNHITFHNYINDCLDKPKIKVNLRKHIKSSSQIIEYVNVNSKINKQKIKSKSISKNSRCLSNNKSSINTGLKKERNSSQLIKALFTKKNTIKSPFSSKNNISILKTSKATKKNSASFISKIKSTKNLKEEKMSTNEKRNIVGKNNIKYYSTKYDINCRKKANPKLEKNKGYTKYDKTNKIQNKFFKQKTQSDIKVNKFNKREEKNRENIIKKENEDNGFEKMIKQKLLDRINKITKNTYGDIRKKKKDNNFSEIMKSSFKNKEYSITQKNFYNKRLISKENSKNEEKEIINEKNIEKRNQFELKIIKDYRGTNTYNNFF